MHISPTSLSRWHSNRCTAWVVIHKKHKEWKKEPSTASLPLLWKQIANQGAAFSHLPSLDHPAQGCRSPGYRRYHLKQKVNKSKVLKDCKIHHVKDVDTQKHEEGIIWKIEPSILENFWEQYLFFRFMAIIKFLRFLTDRLVTLSVDFLVDFSFAKAHLSSPLTFEVLPLRKYWKIGNEIWLQWSVIQGPVSQMNKWKK